MIRVIALVLLLMNLGLLAWQYWLEPETELTPPLSESLPPLVLVTEAQALVVNENGSVGEPATGSGDPATNGDASLDSTAEDSPEPEADLVTEANTPAEEGVVPTTSSDTAASEAQTPNDEATAIDANQVPVPPAPAMVCRSVGPFTSQAESRRAAAMLAETGRVPLQRVTEGEVWLGYWVFLAPFESAEAADEVAQALARALVEDFYIIRTGDLANAISLGVYSQTEGAEARLNEMRDRGFPAELTDRYRSAPVYWLDFAEAADAPLSLSLLMPAAPGRVLRSESGDCALP